MLQFCLTGMTDFKNKTEKINSIILLEVCGIFSLVWGLSLLTPNLKRLTVGMQASNHIRYYVLDKTMNVVFFIPICIFEIPKYYRVFPCYTLHHLHLDMQKRDLFVQSHWLILGGCIHTLRWLWSSWHMYVLYFISQYLAHQAQNIVCVVTPQCKNASLIHMWEGAADNRNTKSMNILLF